MRIKVRPALPTDYPFIFATYIRNRWFSKDNKTTLKRSTWSAMQHRRLEAIFEAKQPVYVACLDEDDDTILGYSLKDGKGVFVYVKLAFRAPGFQLADRLLKELSNK